MRGERGALKVRFLVILYRVEYPVRWLEEWLADVSRSTPVRTVTTKKGAPTERPSLSKVLLFYFTAVSLPPARTTSTQRPMLRAFTVWSYIASQ